MKRFDAHSWEGVDFEEDSNGAWVIYDDVQAALEELEFLKKDAARYRWLRNDPPLTLSVRRFPGETARGCYLDDVNLDKAIDAAMKAGA